MPQDKQFQKVLTQLEQLTEQAQPAISVARMNDLLQEKYEDALKKQDTYRQVDDKPKPVNIVSISDTARDKLMQLMQKDPDAADQTVDVELSDEQLRESIKKVLDGNSEGFLSKIGTKLWEWTSGLLENVWKLVSNVVRWSMDSISTVVTQLGSFLLQKIAVAMGLSTAKGALQGAGVPRSKWGRLLKISGVGLGVAGAAYGIKELYDGFTGVEERLGSWTKSVNEVLDDPSSMMSAVNLPTLGASADTSTDTGSPASTEQPTADDTVGSMDNTTVPPAPIISGTTPPVETSTATPTTSSDTASDTTGDPLLTPINNTEPVNSATGSATSEDIVPGMTLPPQKKSPPVEGRLPGAGLKPVPGKKATAKTTTASTSTTSGGNQATVDQSTTSSLDSKQLMKSVLPPPQKKSSPWNIMNPFPAPNATTNIDASISSDLTTGDFSMSLNDMISADTLAVDQPDPQMSTTTSQPPPSIDVSIKPTQTKADYISTTIKPETQNTLNLNVNKQQIVQQQKQQSTQLLTKLTESLKQSDTKLASHIQSIATDGKGAIVYNSVTDTPNKYITNVNKYRASVRNMST